MSKIISREEITSIKQKTNIVDVIRDYIPLKQNGKNFSGICPFHDDHSPSLKVSPEKQMYKCFTCGNAGNVFNFVMEFEKISYIEAVKKVAEKQGIFLDIQTNTKVQKKEDNERLYKIYDIACKFYQNNLNTEYGKDAKKYLSSRNLDENIIKEFNIGLSFNDSELYNILSKKGFKDDEIIESALCYKSKNQMIDVYKNRIMFPLYDLEGRVNGFSGREYLVKTPNKYINTPETKIFKKGELLYNYHIARPLARKEKSIIIVEGFMDVIRLSTIGIKNVVATMGTAVTKFQENTIRRMAPNIILMFDGDKPGIDAASKYLTNYSDNQDNIKIVTLEDNLDPDEYIINKGKDKMLYHLSHPVSKYDYKLNQLKSNVDFNNSKDVANYINLMIPEIEKINDDIVRDIEIKKLSELTKVDKELIKSKINIKEDQIKEIKPIIKNMKLSKYDKASRFIIYKMLHSNNMIDNYYNNLSYLPDELYRKLANEIVLYYKKFKSFSVEDFIIYLEDKKELINLIIDIDDSNYTQDELNEDIENYFKLIREYLYESKIKQLTESLKNETNEIKRKEIAQEIMQIKLKEIK